MDVFDKFNFTGARVPRFEDIKDDFPRELESSVSFPADVFKPLEKKGDSPRKPHPAGRSCGPGGAETGSSAVTVASRHRCPLTSPQVTHEACSTPSGAT